MIPRLPAPWHRRLFQLGLGLLILGLWGLGVQVALDPVGAAQGYGVPVDPAAIPWVRAAGLRDVVLGLVLAHLWRRHPRALTGALAALCVLPLGDVWLVAGTHAAGVALLPHVLGTVAVAALALLSATQRPPEAP